MAKRQTTYLILEDSCFNSMALAALMAELRPGYHLAGVAESGEEAMEFLAQGNIELIIAASDIADVRTLDLIRRCNIPLPFVLVSESRPDDFLSFPNMVECLLKPISGETLGKALAKYEAVALYPVTTTTISDRL